MVTAAIILALTYVGIAFTKLPWINVDRTAASLCGALLMILAGVLTFEEAVDAVDFNTLALLLGMMMLVVVLQQGGLFTLVSTKAVALADSPTKLLVSVVVATGVLSALLVNDVVVLLFTPVVIQACRMQRVNPMPYLIGEAMASNIGSTATIVGNPQNMIIGVSSGISYPRFFAYLAPVAAASTMILLIALLVFYRRSLATPMDSPANPGPGEALAVAETKVDPRALYRSVPILAALTVTFAIVSIAGPSIPVLALTAGVVSVLLSGIRPLEVISRVDWALLLFFGGLFVVIGGADRAGLLDWFLERVSLSADATGIVSIHLFSAVVSQLVSNVPLTVLMLPFLRTVPGNTLWISLAAGATLGGNATLIGAVANLIVAEQAYHMGVTVRFSEFLRVGVPVTVATVGISIALLILEFHTGFLR